VTRHERWQPACSLAKDARELCERVEAGIGELDAGKTSMDMAPRSASDEHGEHPRTLGGSDVVVDAISDVSDLRRRSTGLGADASEERGIGLLDPPALRGRDQLDRKTETRQLLLGRGRLVAGEADAVAAAVQQTQTGNDIGVQVRRFDPHGADRRRDTQKPPDTPVIFSACNKRAQSGEKRESGDTRFVSALGPGARLIDERLADVEHRDLYPRHPDDATAVVTEMRAAVAGHLHTMAADDGRLPAASGPGVYVQRVAAA